VALAAAAFGLGGAGAGLGIGLGLGRQWAGAVLAGLVAAVLLAIGSRWFRRLLRWPSSRIGFFQDRLLIAHGPQEVHVVWSDLELATLAAQAEWGVMVWPAVKLTDRITLRLSGGAIITFRPASLGLEPVACRDLLLRLRDDRAARARLPVFRTAFSKDRLRSGELIRPDI
jgi:hypothetical protein